MGSTSYYVPDDSPQCVIDISNEVGEHVAQVFTGIMINALGEEKFQVRRIQGEPITTGALEATETGCEK